MVVFFDMLGFTLKVFILFISIRMLFFLQVLESFFEPEIKSDNSVSGGLV